MMATPPLQSELRSNGLHMLWPVVGFLGVQFLRIFNHDCNSASSPTTELCGSGCVRHPLPHVRPPYVLAVSVTYALDLARATGPAFFLL